MQRVAIISIALASLSCSSGQTIRAHIIAHDAVALCCLNGFAHYRFLAKTADGRYVRLSGSRPCDTPLPAGLLGANHRFRVRRAANCDGLIVDARPWGERGKRLEAGGVESVEMSGLVYEDPSYEEPSLEGRRVDCYELVDMPPRPVL